jgi:hypothetical protein
MTSITDIRSAIATELGKTVLTTTPEVNGHQVLEAAVLGHDQSTMEANAARIRELELQIEIEKLKAEQSKLKGNLEDQAKKPSLKPGKSAPEAKIVEDQARNSGNPPTKIAVNVAVPDDLLVEIVKALRMPVAKEGKYAGQANTPTIAKLVYATLYQYIGSDPVSKAMVSQVIDSAVERKVLSRRFSATCMLLWDYTEMPNPDRPNSKALPTDLASKLAAIFARK